VVVLDGETINLTHLFRKDYGLHAGMIAGLSGSFRKQQKAARRPPPPCLPLRQTVLFPGYLG